MLSAGGKDVVFSPAAGRDLQFLSTSKGLESKVWRADDVPGLAAGAIKTVQAEDGLTAHQTPNGQVCLHLRSVQSSVCHGLTQACFGLSVADSLCLAVLVAYKLKLLHASGLTHALQSAHGPEEHVAKTIGTAFKTQVFRLAPESLKSNDIVAVCSNATSVRTWPDAWEGVVAADLTPMGSQELAVLTTDGAVFLLPSEASLPVSKLALNLQVCLYQHS